MTEIDLSAKYPRLQTLSKPPSLFTFNGCGLSIYGRRDTDEETGVYVKTHAACLVFLPIFFLSAYLVADAPGGNGWHFLGRLPLSTRAKLWNVVVGCLLASLVTVGFWSHYTSSPEYLAAADLETAEQRAAQGKWRAAADLWAGVINGRTQHAGVAETKLAEAVAGAFTNAEADRLAALVHGLRGVKEKATRKRLTAGLYDRGQELVDSRVEADPPAALALFDALAGVAPEETDLARPREALLERAVAARPELPGPASQLAVILEERGERQRLASLLEPHAERLGDLEGARILGQMRLEEGRYDEGFSLLLPFTEKGLSKLRKAEADYQRVINAAWERQVERLNEGHASAEWYAKYERSDGDQQDLMVQEWIGERLRSDEEIQRLEAAVSSAATVVPTALDLGLWRVQRAYSLSGDERRQELEAAEKTFLAIQGFAGESEEYRLALGQVYYWLGRPEEGRKLFDELMESADRSPEMLVNVGQMLRSLGAEEEAGRLAEEAYGAADEAEAKYSAAHLRALLADNEDDRLLWYGRSNPADPEVSASLAVAKGDSAVSHGRHKEAERHYRQALAVYAKQPENSSTLNNAALVHFNLFSLTGKREAFRRGADKVERALSLQPSDRILLGNTAFTLARVAALDVIGDRLDFAALQTDVELEDLYYLYDNKQQQAEVQARLASRPAAQKARSYLEKVLVLAPRDAVAYGQLMGLFSSGVGDEAEALRGLYDRTETADLDFAAGIESARRFWSGETRETLRQEYEAAVALRRRVVEAVRGHGASTRSAALTGLSEALLTAWVFGLDVSLDEAVQWAELAVETAPSSASRQQLQSALILRAAVSLAADSDSWAQLLHEYRALPGPISLVQAALGRGGPWGEALAADPDIQRAAKLIRRDLASYPRASVWQWTLLQTVDPAAAQEAASRILGDEVSRLRIELAARLAPASSSAQISLYWYHRLAGKTDEAQSVILRVRKLGMPLPEELFPG